ncbi:MAG: 1-acyl-sn-glycerol-3-phosphate acyltransferase, partial [Armatimonadetes bacterium]|nr:1-acyl-sn-glycerol-3-phosphate acyltransferase [Armatimonadota bacterium]
MTGADRLSENTWVFYLWRALFRSLFRSMGLDLAGTENVPAQGPLIVASNHRSHADPPLVGVVLPRPVHYMAKRELFRVPILGSVIPRMGAFPVSRGHPDRRALRYALRLLSEGEAVVMFPEGTRSLDGRLREPELGVALIALKSRAPVLPVALQGSEHILPKHSVIPHAHPLKVRVGPPLTFDDLYGKRGDRDSMVEVGRR